MLLKKMLLKKMLLKKMLLKKCYLKNATLTWKKKTNDLHLFCTCFFFVSQKHFFCHKKFPYTISFFLKKKKGFINGFLEKMIKKTVNPNQKKVSNNLIKEDKTRLTGFEPATSAVTGRRSNRWATIPCCLNYKNINY